jgi:histone H3
MRFTSHTTPATDPENPILETGVKKRKYRFKSGTVALRAIKKLQTTTNLLVQKSPFRKLVKQITAEMGIKILYQQKAMEALQEAVEHYLIEKFKVANKHAIHANRKTIAVADLQMIEN